MRSERLLFLCPSSSLASEDPAVVQKPWNSSVFYCQCYTHLSCRPELAITAQAAKMVPRSAVLPLPIPVQSSSPLAPGGSEWNHYCPPPESHFLLHIKLSFSAQHFLADWWGKNAFLFLSQSGYPLKLQYQNQEPASANCAKRTFLSLSEDQLHRYWMVRKRKQQSLGHVYNIYFVCKTPTDISSGLGKRSLNIGRGSLESLSPRTKNCVSKRKRCQWRFMWCGRSMH